MSWPSSETSRAGIYIVANDRVLDWAMALLNSLRRFDPDTPILLIPYDERYERTACALRRFTGTAVFPDLDLVEDLSRRAAALLPSEAIGKANRLRNLACWFGPFERFLYLDADIVVFERIADMLDLLDEHDFVCCDYQHRGGVQHVFTPEIRRKGLLADADLLDVFNGGLWGSRREAISERTLLDTLAECARHIDALDFSRGGAAQPILNYLVLRTIRRRCNITRLRPGEPGSWAGSKHFEIRGDALYDRGRRLRYLHWAGVSSRADMPYASLWEQWRRS